MSDCEHFATEPVLLTTGEHVADVCVDCLMRLEPGYGCPDCEWVEIAAFGGPRKKLRVRFCPAHNQAGRP